MIIAAYSDKSLVVNILCRAFDKNKSVNYVVKQDHRRTARIKSLMEYSFDMCFMFGQVYLSDDRSACALTLYTDRKKTSLKSIILDLKLLFLSIGIGGLSKVLNRDSLIKKSYPKYPLLYLWFIGVDPGKQGKGTGSVLLGEIIKQNNFVKWPIYLETSMSENLPFYKKLGFDIYKELDFGYKLFLISKHH